MAEISTTAVGIGNGPVLLQNLGPDDAYVGNSSVDDESGFKLQAGESVAMHFSNSKIFVVSEGTSDIRKLHGGTGVFVASVPETP